MRKRRPTERWRKEREQREKYSTAYGGGHKGLGHTQLKFAKGLKGSTFGPANAGRSLSDEERKAVEAQMRKDGKL